MNVIWNETVFFKYNFPQYEYISMQKNKIKNYFENFVTNVIAFYKEIEQEGNYVQ